MIKLRFMGAAGTVTGSKYLIDTGKHRFMVDCGLFQGVKPLRERNWEPLPIDPSTVEALVVTHAHIDHTGYLPRLGRDGFSGPIHCTHGTKDLTGLLLRDSAHLQEEEANYQNRKRISKHHPALPLYTMADAEYIVGQLEGHAYETSFEVVPGVRVTFYDAGHILGSTWVTLDFEEEPMRLTFSGDLGRVGTPILKDPKRPEWTDYLVLESTYGDRLHGEHDIPGNFAKIIERNYKNRGVLVIPAFAVERSQEVLYLLNELTRRKDMPGLPVFLDSPMAIRATRLFREHTKYYDKEARELMCAGEHILDYPYLKLCDSVAESKAIAQTKPPFIVISASGMATGGRILHHLMNHLPNPNNEILMVGYQSVGTRGWRLLKGEKQVKIFGKMIPVKARISQLEGFSGHADYKEIGEWLTGLSQPPLRTFLTHGDPPALEAQRERLSGKGWDIKVPEHNEEVELSPVPRAQ